MHFPITHHASRIALYAFFLLLLHACRTKPAIPAEAVETSEAAILYPDCDSIVLPPNIAPLGLSIANKADEAVAVLGGLVADCPAERDFLWDEDEWHKLLQSSKGKTLPLDIYTKSNGKWQHHPTQHITVAEEEIDSFLVYRLIEPGYELYRQLGLYERNLTNFDERAIVENNRQYDTIHNHCLNCHNFQGYDTRRWLFHVRGSHGGTMIVEDGQPRKVDMRTDSTLAAGVYPSWHPTENLVALSTNKTGQIFHMYHRERIEVLDEASDLLLYDPVNNTVENIIKSDSALETFPCWHPSGDRLYYCSAFRPALPAAMADSLITQFMASKYDSLIYDIWSVPFDARTRSFGAPRLEVSDGHSASVPRISPDGRYLLYARGDYGQFHIWHPSADLWVKDLERDTTYALSAANSPEGDSYHTWSSNGRWIAFASRRDDGNFSRVFISYFDRQGQAHRPFMLPQRSARHNTLLLKSYNVPELISHRIPCQQGVLQEAVMLQEARKAKYSKKR